jgi:cation diffusion facilitator CzcD-associated flavoprotein CzcO
MPDKDLPDKDLPDKDLPDKDLPEPNAPITETLECDYLIIGAGAMGMAFADELVSGSDAEIILVDRGHQPGGHWNTAYPFVRLHQPSACYGVNSTPLGRDRIDLTGGMSWPAAVR